MGMTKKLYMDWCEQNDINPDLELSQDMAWTSEFEQWLDKLAKCSPLSEEELNEMGKANGLAQANGAEHERNDRKV